jgi:hypothetical protein
MQFITVRTPEIAVHIRQHNQIEPIRVIHSRRFSFPDHLHLVALIADDKAQLNQLLKDGSSRRRVGLDYRCRQKALGDSEFLGIPEREATAQAIEKNDLAIVASAGSQNIESRRLHPSIAPLTLDRPLSYSKLCPASIGFLRVPAGTPPQRR